MERSGVGPRVWENAKAFSLSSGPIHFFSFLSSGPLKFINQNLFSKAMGSSFLAKVSSEIGQDGKIIYEFRRAVEKNSWGQTDYHTASIYTRTVVINNELESATVFTDTKGESLVDKVMLFVTNERADDLIDAILSVYTSQDSIPKNITPYLLGMIVGTGVGVRVGLFDSIIGGLCGLITTAVVGRAIQNLGRSREQEMVDKYLSLRGQEAINYVQKEFIHHPQSL